MQFQACPPRGLGIGKTDRYQIGPRFADVACDLLRRLVSQTNHLSERGVLREKRGPHHNR